MAMNNKCFRAFLSKQNLEERIEVEDNTPYLSFCDKEEETADNLKSILTAQCIAFDMYYQLVDNSSYTYFYRPETAGLCPVIRYCNKYKNMEDIPIKLGILRRKMKKCGEDVHKYYECMKRILYEDYPSVPQLEEWTRHIKDNKPGE